MQFSFWKGLHMDITEANSSKAYVNDGADAQPTAWKTLAEQRAEWSAGRWVAHVGVFLQEHARLVGSPAISTRRTEIYRQLPNCTDVEQLEVDVTKLVQDADAVRVKLVELDAEYASKFASILSGR